jgi:hypothetical protein
MPEIHRLLAGRGSGVQPDRPRRIGRPVNVVGRRAARAAGLAAAVIMGVATLAGLVRVLPWIVAPNVPFRVALPFARALFAVGLETTLLCAPPIGWALAASTLVERGEARAFFALGLSPARVVRSTVGVAAGFAAFSALAALAWGTEASAPGRLARSLVEQSKRSCAGEVVPRTAHVPFVGVTWLCFQDQAPRLSGALPGGGGTFTAADLAIADDLRSLYFSDMRLLLGDGGGFRVHVDEARVTGLSPWGRASNLRPAVRALLLSVTGAILALLASFFVLSRSVSNRLLSLLIGGVGPVAALLAMSRLEQGEHAPLIYAWVPLAALLGQAGAIVLERTLGRSRPIKSRS